MKVLLVAMLAIIFSFPANAQKKYEKMGISFKIPSGWKITDEQPEKNATYFTCEKEGDNESGMVSFVYIGSDADVNSFLQLCMQNTENSANMSDGKNFKWGSDTTDVNLGDFHARKVTYSVSYLDIPFSGSIIVYRGCGNMVMLNPQEANEDKKKNRKGFETILGTIRCR